MDPVTAALTGALIQGGSSILSGIFGRQKRPRETAIQKQQRANIDSIMSGLRGEGPLAYLFSPDQESFQQSVVEPSLQRFNQQIAPAISQRFVAQGQERGTGLENALTRAGVDLNSLLSSQYQSYLDSVMNRATGALGAVQGAGAGFQPGGQQNAFASSLAGYLGSGAPSEAFQNIIDAYAQNEQSTRGPRRQPDFTPVDTSWEPYQFRFDTERRGYGR